MGQFGAQVLEASCTHAHPFRSLCSPPGDELPVGAAVPAFWFTHELPQLSPDLPCQESCLGQAVEL